MEHFPIISVVIPFYEGSRHIAETLDSVFAQEYPNMEIILVNDGSSSESLVSLEPYLNRISVIHQKNQGQSAARNTGLEHAHGDLIALLDQDDLWPKDHLSLLLPHLIGTSDYDFSQGYITEFRIDDSGNRAWGEPYLHRVLVGSALFKKNVFDIVGGFDATMREGEDFDWTIRLKESACKGFQIPDVTLLYRRHETNYSNMPNFIQKGEFLSIRKKLQRARAEQNDHEKNP